MLFRMFPPPCLPAFDDPPLTITHQPPARDIDGRGKSSLFTKAKTSPHGAGSDRLRSAFEWRCAQPCFGNRQHGPQPPARVRAGASLTVPQLRLLYPNFAYPASFPPFPPSRPFPPFPAGRVEIGRGEMIAGSMFTQPPSKYAKVENERG
jgi:hypothetical protein